MGNGRSILRRAGAVTLLVVSALLLATNAYADGNHTGPPDANGLYGYCTMHVDGTAYGSDVDSVTPGAQPGTVHAYVSCTVPAYGYQGINLQVTAVSGGNDSFRVTDSTVCAVGGSTSYCAVPGYTGTTTGGLKFRMTLELGPTACGCISKQIDTTKAAPLQLKDNAGVTGRAGRASPLNWESWVTNATTYGNYPPHWWGSIDPNTGYDSTPSSPGPSGPSSSDNDTSFSGTGGANDTQSCGAWWHLGCWLQKALKWAFVPNTTSLGTTWDSTRQTLATHYPFGPVVWAVTSIGSAWSAVKDGLTDTFTDCKMTVRLPFYSGASGSISDGYQLTLLDNCADSALAPAMTVVKLISQVMILLGTGMLAWRIFGRVMGMGGGDGE